MGKKSGLRVTRVAPTPPIGRKEPTPKKPVEASTLAAAAAAPAAPAAVNITKEVQESEVVVTTEDVAPTRAAAIEELPEFGNVTGLTAVEAGITLHLTPLRSAAWADFYFDEATSVSVVMGKTQGLIRALDKELSEKLPGFDLAAVSVRGATEVAALRCSEPFKNGRCGVYKIRVLEACSEAVMGAVGDVAVVTPAFGVEFTHETIIADEFYPGAVIEQISEQNNGLAAAFKRDFSIGKNVFVYQVQITSAAQLAIVEKRGHFVQLGAHGKFALRAVERKVTFETIYAYGCSGLGSAKDILQGPLAASLAVPKDMVRVSGVNSTIASAGTVVAIRYPYSAANYDAAAQLLDQAYFKLRHSAHSSFAIEITLAITPLELQKRLAIRLVRDVESSESEEDEGVGALDLRITEGDRWWLEPDTVGARGGERGGGVGGVEAMGGGEETGEEQAEEGRSGGGEEVGVVEGRHEVRMGGSRGDCDFKLPYYLSYDFMSYDWCSLPGLLVMVLTMWVTDLHWISTCTWQFREADDAGGAGGGAYGGGSKAERWAEADRGGTWTRARRMERLLGWGFCVRAQRRRK